MGTLAGYRQDRAVAPMSRDIESVPSLSFFLCKSRRELLRPWPRKHTHIIIFFLSQNRSVWTLVDGEPADRSVANGWDVHSAVWEVQRVSRDDLSVGG